MYKQIAHKVVRKADRGFFSIVPEGSLQCKSLKFIKE
jgi:hypothetical protein